MHFDGAPAFVPAPPRLPASLRAASAFAAARAPGGTSSTTPVPPRVFRVPSRLMIPDRLADIQITAKLSCITWQRKTRNVRPGSLRCTQREGLSLSRCRHAPFPSARRMSERERLDKNRCVSSRESRSTCVAPQPCRAALPRTASSTVRAWNPPRPRRLPAGVTRAGACRSLG
jgi:hypothetical protein